MSPLWRRRAIWLAAQAVLTFAWHWISKLTFKLGDHAVIGWVDDQIGEHFGITAAKVIAILWDWGPPFLLAAVTLYGLHLFHKHQYRQVDGISRKRQSTSARYLPTENEIPPGFRRWRWWYALWGGPPFHSYKARKRLEFIDSWQRFYDEKKQADTARSYKGGSTPSEDAVNEAKKTAVPSFQITLAESASQIGDYAPVAAITITNIESSDLERRCLVSLEEFTGVWPKKMAKPLPLRTDGQIRRQDSDRFVLSKGQSETIPLLFFDPIRKNEWYFFDEQGDKHFVPAGPQRLKLKAFGGSEVWTGLVTIETDAGWRPRSFLETVPADYNIRDGALSADSQNTFYPPTVSVSPTRIQDGLNVSDIRLTFQDLKKERHSELTMRVFNGTGRVIDFADLSGQIKFNAPNNADPSRMGTLPTPQLNPTMAKSVNPLEEWFVFLSQRVPSTEADKILSMLKAGISIHFDLTGLNIQIVGRDTPTDTVRLPVWGGVSYSKGAGFGRIIHATGSASLSSRAGQ